MDKNPTIRVLAVRTDKPEAELYIYEGMAKLAEIKWLADRQLTKMVHLKINEILNVLSISLNNVDGIVCYKGPGSFTGLRIGASVANALAYCYKIPLVARGGENWINDGINDLSAGKNDKIITPEYGASPKTTPPKK